jgi:hypothetical protein
MKSILFFFLMPLSVYAQCPGGQCTPSFSYQQQYGQYQYSQPYQDNYFNYQQYPSRYNQYQYQRPLQTYWQYQNSYNNYPRYPEDGYYQSYDNFMDSRDFQVPYVEGAGTGAGRLDWYNY